MRIWESEIRQKFGEGMNLKKMTDQVNVVVLKLSSPEIQKNSVKSIFRHEIHTAFIRQKVRPEFRAGHFISAAHFFSATLPLGEDSF
jgi:hypothetical protein